MEDEATKLPEALKGLFWDGDFFPVVSPMGFYLAGGTAVALYLGCFIKRAISQWVKEVALSES